MRVSNGRDAFEVDESRLSEAVADGFQPLVKVTNGTETYDVHPSDLEKAKADGFAPESLSAPTFAPQLASAGPAIMPPGGTLESIQDGLRGAVQTGSLGFADEISGGVRAGIDAFKKGSLSDVVADYVAHRNAERSADKASQTRSPVAYGVGQVGGAVATSLIPGAGVGKLVAMGAAEGLGGSEADLTKGDVGNAVLDAGKGAATGFAFGKLGKARAGLEEVATNPTISKIANVNPGGRVMDAVAKRFGISFEDIPGAFVPYQGTTMAGKIAQRAAGHFVPGMQYVQKASDAAAVVQKGAMVSLDTIDKIASKLGKYGPILKEAAQRGGSSLTTTNFLLQQTDPDYQQTLKNLEENQ